MSISQLPTSEVSTLTSKCSELAHSITNNHVHLVQLPYYYVTRFTKFEIYIVGIQLYDSGSATLGSPQTLHCYPYLGILRHTVNFKKCFRLLL